MVLAACAAAAVLLAPAVVPAHAGARASSCKTSHLASTGGAFAIPDPGSTDAALGSSASGFVKTLAVGVNVTHPFDSDLQLVLVSPIGTAVTLAEANGTWGQDFKDTVFSDAANGSIISALPPFTGSFRPLEPLSAFVGAKAKGRWTLRVSDLRAGYAGHLDGWSLDLTTCAKVKKPSAAVGAAAVPPLPTGVPNGDVPAQGTTLIVTSAADSGAGSLRDAITTTNNAPGTYTIRFASSLAGATIHLASLLPPLQGGGVLIDGDVNGDGRPDVTVDGGGISEGDRGGISAFRIFSSDNRLHALALQGFTTGVFLAPARDDTDPTVPSHQTYARNVVSGLVITGISREGISLWPTLGYPECASSACGTHNQWTDDRFVGNTIRASQGAVEAILYETAGDAVQRWTIAGNDIRVDTGAFGINLAIGRGAGADGNSVSDALVAYNSLDATAAGPILTTAINATSGFSGGSSNTIENLQIVDNHVRFAAGATKARGITFTMSDGCSGTGPGTGVCSKSNVAKDIEVTGNSLQGQDEGGVLAAEPCCGTANQSTLGPLRIVNNVVGGTVPIAHLDPWGIEIGYPASNVTVDHNSVTQTTTDPGTAHAATLAGGGIAILGGLGSDHKTVQGITVTNNRVDTDLVGITIVGGGISDDPAAGDSVADTVTNVRLRGNVIGRRPTLVAHWDPAVKGISIIGGLGGTPPSSGHWRQSSGDRVTGVVLDHNRVAGAIDAYSLHADLGDNASGNTAAPPKKAKKAR